MLCERPHNDLKKKRHVVTIRGAVVTVQMVAVTAPAVVAAVLKPCAYWLRTHGRIRWTWPPLRHGVQTMGQLMQSENAGSS